MASSPTLLVLLGLALCGPLGTWAQGGVSTDMYVKMLEAMVRRLGGQLPTRSSDMSPASSASTARCGSPLPMPRSSMSFTSRQAGAVVRYTCDIGYGPGEATRVCQPNGQWSPLALVCNPVECGLPTTVPGGVATYTSTTYGSSATYACKGGYSHVRGTTVAVCREDGQWSKPSITCSPLTPADSSTGAQSMNRLRSLLSTFQNTPLASRLSPEMRAVLSKSQQVLNSFSPTAPPVSRPVANVPSSAAAQGSLPPNMMAMLDRMKASMPPAMKAMLANAVPTRNALSTATPSMKPTPTKPKHPMQNMQNMMKTMQQMQMMRMLMGQKSTSSGGKGGGAGAMDPEAIAEAAADTMQRSMLMGMAGMSMPNMMGMSSPLAAMMGNSNPMMALRNAFNQNMKNDPFAFPVSNQGVPGNRNDPFLFEVATPPGSFTSGRGQQSQSSQSSGMNPVLMAALMGNGQQMNPMLSGMVGLLGGNA